jgi:hypothetical protein
MLQDQVRGHVRPEGSDDRERRQHRIERALEADELVAVQDASTVGDVDQPAAQAEADLGEQPVRVCKRRGAGRQPAIAEDDHVNAAPDLLLRPAIECRRRRPPEPSNDSADIRGPFGVRQAGADIPERNDEAEMIERHLGEAVNPALVRPRLLAAVVDRKDFALHSLRAGPVAERLRQSRLRPGGRRQQQRAQKDQHLM